MIGVNPLRTKVLITTDEVLFHSPIDHQADPRVILQGIIVAERRFIKPILGATVYKAMVDAKNTLVTNANKAALQTAVNTGRPASRAAIVLNEGDYVNSDTYLTTAQQDLWNNHLHKIVAECVWFICMPVNRSRFTAQGIEVNNPESIGGNQSSQSVRLSDLKHLMDRALTDRIYPLIEDMHAYMCEVAFVGYDRKCDCDDYTSTRKKGGIITSIYDDEESCHPCRRGDRYQYPDD